MIASTWGTIPELMGETLRDLPAGLVPSPFFAHIFSMHGTVRTPKSRVGQGPEPHFFWSNVHLCGWRWVGQVECGATKPVINSARPMAPAVPRAPRACAPAIPVAGSGLAPFRHLLPGRWGVPAPKGQSKGSRRSGRILGGMGPERCGSGAPNQPFEWPHSRFGRARYFFSDPPFGLWGLFKNPIGQNLGQ